VRALWFSVPLWWYLLKMIFTTETQSSTEILKLGHYAFSSI